MTLRIIILPMFFTKWNFYFINFFFNIMIYFFISPGSILLHISTHNNPHKPPIWIMIYSGYLGIKK